MTFFNLVRFTAGAFSSSKLPVVSAAGISKILCLLCSNFVVLIILSFFGTDSSFSYSFLVQKIVNFHYILTSATWESVANNGNK
jgi:hypothetical protein